MNIELTHLQDAGHGWIVCPASLVTSLGLANRISRFSFLDRISGTAYLEEDCDAPLFIQALESSGWEPSIKPVYVSGDAKCRNLPRFGA